MSKDNYVELPREKITFYGDTENEKKANELLFDMGLELSALDDELKAKDKEIERLKNGYCELKVKCNNGECDCTNEEYNGMVQANMKLSLEVDRLNNIINETKRILGQYVHYSTPTEEQNAKNEAMVDIAYEQLGGNNLKELKEDNK